MSNIKRFGEKKTGHTPKKYDPDEAPSGYNPVLWRLMRKFVAGSRLWSSHDLEPKKFIIYSRLDHCMEHYGMNPDHETENLVQDMFGEFWVNYYENNPIEEMFSLLTWEKMRRIVLNHYESMKISAELDAQAEARGPVEYQPTPPGRAKPPRHKLGRPTEIGELDDFGPEVREFMRKHAEKQEDE